MPCPAALPMRQPHEFAGVSQRRTCAFRRCLFVNPNAIEFQRRETIAFFSYKWADGKEEVLGLREIVHTALPWCHIQIDDDITPGIGPF